MLRKWVLVVSERLWLRVVLAVALIIVGLAPVGAPILSDNAFRQALRSGSAPEANSAYNYRWLVQADGSSRIQRSESGKQAATWNDLGTLSETVVQLESVQGSSGLMFARTKESIWRSDDGGSHWAHLQYPGRPFSMAVAQHTQGMVLAGSQSQGLFRSLDNGVTWQSVGQALMAGGAGPFGVSAVTISPDDERVIYAAPGYWLGTNQVRFSALGIYASVDGAKTWFPMVAMVPVAGHADASTQNSMAQVSQLIATTGHPLEVSAVSAASGLGSSATAERGYTLAITPQFEAGLDSTDRDVRAATARAIGLSGNHSMMPMLLAHLHDTDLYVGDQLAEAIGRLNDPSAVAPLVEALKDQDEAVRGRAASALGLMHAEQAVPQLAIMLRQDGPLARGQVADALAAIGTPQAVAALIAPLADANLTPARQAAMQGIEQAGQGAVAALTTALHDSAPAMRRNAAEMLGYVQADSATSVLAQALSDTDSGVRSEAAWALGEIGTVQARQALAQAVRTERDQPVLDSMRQAMEQAPGQRSVPLTPGEALMSALTQVPVGRWTFLALLVILAAILIVASPRQLHLDRSRGAKV
jgi:HEAT repeat protein